MFNTLGKMTVLSLLAAGSIALSGTALAAGPGTAPPAGGCETDCGYERGPDPSVATVEAISGPFDVRTSNVSSLVAGFNGGTIHYPTGTTGTMGAIVVAPGFLSPEYAIEWWGPKLASHGFVVMTIAINNGLDQPPSRARQINAALDYLLDENDDLGSPISGMIDPTRLGAMGWSMGGGGALRVASEGRLSAVIPLAPWDSSSLAFRDIDTPTLFLACERDLVAPVINHASPFYNALPSSTPKAFVEIDDGGHTCANGSLRNNDILSRFGVSWMKLHIDKDQRYSQFLCGPRHESDRSISEYRGNCPY